MNETSMNPDRRVLAPRPRRRWHCGLRVQDVCCNTNSNRLRILANGRLTLALVARTADERNEEDWSVSMISRPLGRMLLTQLRDGVSKRPARRTATYDI